MTTPTATRGFRFLPCDTDVLIQLFLGGSLRPLQFLSAFAIQPVLTTEVEIEFTGSRKGRALEPQLSKAIAQNLLHVVEKDYFLKRMIPDAGDVASRAVYDRFQSLGALYRKHIGLGEAYTHALGVTLAIPVASNDKRAIDVLRRLGLDLPSPVLRFFDLVVCAHQEGALPAGDCDQIRKALHESDEGVDAAFHRTSFRDGLSRFVPRLIIADRDVVGDNGPVNPSGVETRQMLRRP